VIVVFAGAVNVAPDVGLIIATLGATLAALPTVTVDAADVAVAPVLSVATAVMEYVPAATFDHVAEYGLVESDARS
jgi:hypothetical protein